MTVGTKSLLYGVHCFFIHPWLVAWAWWRLYGFPREWQLWLCFLFHDIGYLNQPNMDGPEGESHPFMGAELVSVLCQDYPMTFVRWRLGDKERDIPLGTWGMFCLLHSRYLAKKLGHPPSKLAIADKLVLALEPSWLYLPRAIATGEINDYYEQAVKCDPSAHPEHSPTHNALTMIKQGGLTRDPWLWHRGVRAYMTIWVEENKHGGVDRFTRANRGN